MPPDGFAYDTGPGFGGVLADDGLLRSLENAYKEHGWDIYDWAKQQATYGVTVYGVPDQVEEIIVYYNKDLVPEVPQTIEELRQISGEIKRRGKIPLAFGTARLTIEKLNTSPAHPVNIQGLDVPELFKQVRDDLWEFPQAEAFGYNIDVLVPQNFNEVMYSGFRKVIGGMRSPAEQA